MLLDNIPAKVIHDGGRLRFGPVSSTSPPATRPANNPFVGTLRGTHLLRLRVDPASRRIIGQERLLEGQFESRVSYLRPEESVQMLI